MTYGHAQYTTTSIQKTNTAHLKYFETYGGVAKSFRTESITKYTLTFGITR